MSTVFTPKNQVSVKGRIAYCQRCKEPTGNIIFLGEDNYKQLCTKCGHTQIGEEDYIICPECGNDSLVNIGKLEYGDLIFIGLCKECEEEINRFIQIVSEGGIYWICPKGHKGVVEKTFPIAQEIRKNLGIEPPEPCGVEITKEDCPVCRGELHVY